MKCMLSLKSCQKSALQNFMAPWKIYQAKSAFRLVQNTFYNSVEYEHVASQLNKNNYELESYIIAKTAKYLECTFLRLQNYSTIYNEFIQYTGFLFNLQYTSNPVSQPSKCQCTPETEFSQNLLSDQLKKWRSTILLLLLFYN